MRCMFPVLLLLIFMEFLHSLPSFYLFYSLSMLFNLSLVSFSYVFLSFCLPVYLPSLPFLLPVFVSPFLLPSFFCLCLSLSMSFLPSHTLFPQWVCVMCSLKYERVCTIISRDNPSEDKAIITIRRDTLFTTTVIPTKDRKSLPKIAYGNQVWCRVIENVSSNGRQHINLEYISVHAREGSRD